MVEFPFLAFISQIARCWRPEGGRYPLGTKPLETSEGKGYQGKRRWPASATLHTREQPNGTTIARDVTEPPASWRCGKIPVLEPDRLASCVCLEASCGQNLPVQEYQQLPCRGDCNGFMIYCQLRRWVITKGNPY